MKKTVSILIMCASLLVVFGLSGLVSRAAGPLATPKDEANFHGDFDGLIAICFGNSQRVSMGFLDVPHHTPELKIIKLEGGKQTTVVDLKGEQLKDTLYMDVAGRKNSSVSRYYAANKEDVNDFHWTIDMESDIFQKQLYIKEEKLFGKIHFSNGLFYGVELSEDRLRFVSTDNSGQMLPFNRRIATPAMAINLQPNETLVIKGKQVNVQLPAVDGVKYQMHITNIPPADMVNINHFLFYFDILGEKVKVYEPVTVAKAAFYPKPIACFALVFTRSQLN